MSLDASIWAWKAQVKNSSQRLVLLTLADRAGETHRCYAKYQVREQTANHDKQVRRQQGVANQLTDKQITAFSQKLAHHPEFAGFFAYAGESYEQLAARIAMKLSDPVQAKQWERYLKQVGFKGSLQGAA
ncbi:hypothetical protein F4V57_01660 [Acinetobacter qingfengensis]|uniref:Uncharacterized protein n=1 Tax=Acinetobacter qingfengensis TaxID=1262585 RepID=A0A1E7R966_9GAMM|nr:hypothetical protein F4V57_01660 [Acinetobacter qingfengensis]OEY95825.1 hypothetical protein BJI46_02585 [Acinetobacter qingfengensis]